MTYELVTRLGNEIEMVDKILETFEEFWSQS